jgi:hypothetical protein
VVPLGDPGAAAQKLRVEPGTVRQAIMEGGPAAYLVEATAPVSAAWSFQSEVGTAFLTGRAFAG